LRVVVCDTGPILHLKEAEALELLGKTGEVLVPPAALFLFLLQSVQP